MPASTEKSVTTKAAEAPEPRPVRAKLRFLDQEKQSIPGLGINVVEVTGVVEGNHLRVELPHPHPEVSHLEVPLTAGILIVLK